MINAKNVSIVIPCFNEEKGLHHFYEHLITCLPDKYNYEIILIDDGSIDDTLGTIKELVIRNKQVHYISFSRNFGHQNALKAGFDHAKGDCAICLDADLQHPPELIQLMLEKWEEGSEIVNTKREDHQSISLFKKLSSKAFYNFLNSLSEIKIQQGSADFRLLDRKVLNYLRLLTENFIFLRGQVSWLGFKQITLSYKAGERFAGKSGYTLRKMVKFATSGITSFSIKPLRLSIFLGFIFALLAFLYGLYALYIFLFTDKAVAGWTSIVVSVLFVGGVNLLMLGIIGEYLGKLFIENKRRPNYIISESDLII